jgi:hypothetical protein
MVELPIVGGHDPSAFLATVLKGIEAEIGEVGCFKMIINSKDTAHGFSQFFISSNPTFEYQNPKFKIRNYFNQF